MPVAFWRIVHDFSSPVTCLPYPHLPWTYREMWRTSESVVCSERNRRMFHCQDKSKIPHETSLLVWHKNCFRTVTVSKWDKHVTEQLRNSGSSLSSIVFSSISTPKQSSWSTTFPRSGVGCNRPNTHELRCKAQSFCFHQQHSHRHRSESIL